MFLSFDVDAESGWTSKDPACGRPMRLRLLREFLTFLHHEAAGL